MTVEAPTRVPETFANEISLEPVEVRPLASELRFSITTDSVVATATVTPAGPMRKILIAWGDGETSALYSRPGLPTSPAEVLTQEDDPLPAGTYQLSHAYPEPDDRMPAVYYAVLRVHDWDGGEELNIARVEITPRYRCTNWRTRVRLTGPCDFQGESTNEFKITQSVDGIGVHDWDWEPSNNVFGESQSFLLEDSQISRDLTVADGYVAVDFVFRETDLGADDLLYFSAPLSATLDSESVSARVIQDPNALFGTCDLIVRFDREVTLIVPLPDSGHEVVFA
jgi:hypothetical protein